ncbi:orotidine-5'-phosphate decarboxylase [Pseudothermotoga sp.]|nr:orotidine-5'-phosphate decarboxylase [Pseudothermotoga sp.]MCX7813541.1 orotidine-5'-phosphate decarboxylase [Pseudothermotoga sp.]MDW8140538.1 orotidine-5'-phosphate decarboxylase [Pseudothermotoga sp.]
MKLVLSLDMENPIEFIDQYGSFEHVKVGHNLAVLGKHVLDELAKRDLKVILDLKFTDIPSTIIRSIKAWDHPSVVGFTLHAAAGIDSIKAALESTSKLIFVVVKLTSIEGSLEEYAHQVETLRLLGCSFVLPGSWAIKLRKKISGKILVPGVRMERGADDQKDTVTLEQIKGVADFAVIGREIYKSQDPKATMEKMRRFVHA